MWFDKDAVGGRLNFAQVCDVVRSGQRHLPRAAFGEMFRIPL
jgi:hypothetical protein